MTACETLPRAVSFAAEKAAAGDVVLLSPGCASFDAYSDYAARGDVRFLRGRVRFLQRGKPVGTSPFPSAVVVFRPEHHERRATA